jgi:hypothetical protein
LARAFQNRQGQQERNSHTWTARYL